MPSPWSTVSGPDLQTLKAQILQEFGNVVVSITDCTQLADLIEQRTGRNISVNTLRRFFNLMSTASQPSLETLNILSTFCGYADFYDFSRTNDSSLHSDLHSDLKTQAVNELHGILGNTPQFFSILNWLLRLAFKEKDTHFLKEFFDLDLFKRSPDYSSNELKKSLYTFGVGLRANPALFELLTKHYAGHPAAQAFYFEFFVDYDFLPVRHHQAINLYVQSKQGKEARLFSQCVLFLRAFMMNDRETCLDLLKKINAIELDSELHPFPLGRKMSCNLLAQAFFKSKPDKALLREIFDWEPLQPRSGSFGRDLPSYHLLLAEAFTWSGLYAEAVTISELALKTYKTEMNDHTKDVLSNLQMYYAHALLKSGRVNEFMDIFEKIDTNNFDISNRNFSLLNYYRISSESKQKTNPKEARFFLKSSHRIANTFKFRLFAKL